MKKGKNRNRCLFVGVLAMVFAFVLAGCSTPENVVYFQDSAVGVERPITQKANIVAQPGDRLLITVNCPDLRTSSMFALLSPNVSRLGGEAEDVSGDGSLNAFQVSDKGTIDFPVLGKVAVGGLTAPEIAEKIKKELETRQLVKNPIVVADFSNLHYSVLGEVGAPGKYPITNNRVTLMEALAAAGDLTIFGKRENVKVIREENGVRKTYTVDLRGNGVFDSPVYYLKQNDVIYVEPNTTRSGQSTVNDNQWKQPGLWLSIASFLTTIGVLIFK